MILKTLLFIVNYFAVIGKYFFEFYSCVYRIHLCLSLVNILIVVFVIFLSISCANVICLRADSHVRDQTKDAAAMTAGC